MTYTMTHTGNPSDAIYAISVSAVATTITLWVAVNIVSLFANTPTLSAMQATGMAATYFGIVGAALTAIVAVRRT